jgi:predicted AlkP superfamily phosphohydrolase/phosphomutase
MFHAIDLRPKGGFVPRRRVLAIGLDGLEINLAERLMAAGEMPALAALRQRSACFRLDHGAAQRTGLAWEHVASGLSPDSARRWAAVEFDPRTYRVWQEGAKFEPWWAGVDRKVVVFDMPYVDLKRARNTYGIVAWGAHDPGTAVGARPRALLREFLRRFGHYPSEWTYGTPWPSPRRTREMGAALSQALETRARAARWLVTERLADWDFFIAVAGELHGSIEGLWHGVDSHHPLHQHPSAAAAAHGLLAVHRALDRMVHDLTHCAGDAAIVAFAMGGMGPNHSDAQSMVLLPELLYRHAFSRSLLSVPAVWAAAPADVPILEEDDTWDAASARWLPLGGQGQQRRTLYGSLRAAATSRPRFKAGLKRLRRAVTAWGLGERPVQSLAWQPASRYSDHWSRMRAFALPSFYDGRIRINLKGRERDGVVEVACYEETCQTIEALLHECRNPLTGERAVDSVERAATRDPLSLTGSESDLLVVWRGVAAALQHPRLGLIGPVALRRTGGHTGSHGVAYIAGPQCGPGEHGVRSSFDVDPTLVELLGCSPPAGMSGTSLLRP